MPFKCYPQPNIHHWKPEYGTFNQETDRLLVYIGWHDDKIILSWSTDERSTGGLVLAQEAIPENIAWHFGDKLDPFIYAPGETMQPELFVTQMDDNRLMFELTHPAYEGSFDTRGRVYRIHKVQRGRRRHSPTVAGHYHGITERNRHMS